jgi:stage III sporulation protein AF
MEEIYAWIRSIVIYMILNTIIMNLLGGSTYKKYVSIVSGMILVLLVISPLLHIMDFDDKLKDYFTYSNYSIETSDFKNDLQQMEHSQRKLIFAKYQGKIQNQIKAMLLEEGVCLHTFSMNVDQDVQSKTFGQITAFNITAAVEKAEKKSSSTRLINKIEIDNVKLKEAKENAAKRPPSPLEIHTKNRLSDFYNIEPDNINISIQGG